MTVTWRGRIRAPVGRLLKFFLIEHWEATPFRVSISKEGEKVDVVLSLEAGANGQFSTDPHRYSQAYKIGEIMRKLFFLIFDLFF